MLNPISRICFGLAVAFLLWAAWSWLRVRGDQERASSQIRRAALPTGFALGLVGLGFAAMMMFGPWARPYDRSGALESAVGRESGDLDATE